MCKGRSGGTSGKSVTFTVVIYETRKIVIAEGTQAKGHTFRFLKKKLGKDFISDPGNPLKADYINDRQEVHYELEVVRKKSEFKKALETEGIIVAYLGHSRYGRGACFDKASQNAEMKGDHWENGTNDNGLFRLGFPYVPIPLSDIRHHAYHFSPIPYNSGRIPRKRNHPYYRNRKARRRLTKIILPEDLRKYVYPEDKDKSGSNAYWGFTGWDGRKKEKYIILKAGWKNTGCKPNDLAATEIRCKTFCHFGCSSRKHFWDIVRRRQYKNWRRPKPPTDRFSYYTTNTSYSSGMQYWLYHLLTYKKKNNSMHWWKSHEWAKKRANRYLKRDRAKFRIY